MVIKKLVKALVVVVVAAIFAVLVEVVVVVVAVFAVLIVAVVTVVVVAAILAAVFAVLVEVVVAVVVLILGLEKWVLWPPRFYFSLWFGRAIKTPKLFVSHCGQKYFSKAFSLLAQGVVQFYNIGARKLISVPKCI